MSPLRPVLVVLGAAALALSAVGCGDDDPVDAIGTDEAPVDLSPVDDPSEDADASGVDLDPGEVVVEQGDDKVTSGAQFPEDFPEWAVRLPDKFSLLLVQERDVGGDVGWTVLGTVPREPDLVEFGLLGQYGDPDEHAEEAGAIRMRYAEVNGYELMFTLDANDDGDTALTIAVREA